MEVFIIKKLVLDPLENNVAAAIGYRNIGFTYTEEEAIRIVVDGDTATEKDCWAIIGSIPRLTYEKIELI